MSGSLEFRSQIANTPEIVTETPKKPQLSDTLEGYETPTRNPETKEERNLEIWEGLNRRKYVEDYFGAREIASEFMVKMPLAEINKYIVSEMGRREMEMTIDNYQELLSEIENEIGSNKMELFKRFNRLTGYIRAINKLNKAKELRDKYRFVE